MSEVSELRGFRPPLKVLLSLLIFSLSAITAVCGTLPSAGSAVSRKRANVLFISAYSLDWSAVPQKIEGMKSRLGETADIEYLFMDTKHVSEPEAARITKRHLDILRAENPFDLVIASDDAALDFVLKCRGEYFSGIPIVFEGINSEEKAKRAAEDPLITGIAEVLPLRQTLELAVRLMPSATRVVSITDGTDSSAGFLAQLDRFKSAFPRLKFENLDCSKYSQTALAAQIASYGPETILLYMIMGRDGSGTVYSVAQSLRFLSDKIRVPLFKADEAGLGDGLTGGCMISYREMGEQAGGLSLKVLSTDSAQNLPLQPTSHRYMFDYRELVRFGIPLSALPKDSIVINQPPDSSRDVRRILIPVGILIALLIIIIVNFFFFNLKMKRAQEELLRSKRLYIRVGKTARFSEWRYERENRRMLALDDESTDNSMLTRINLSPVIENVPESIAEIAEPQSRQAVYDFFDKMNAGQDGSTEIWYRVKDSDELCCRRLTCFIDRDRTGSVLGIYCIAQDITEQKKEEERYQHEIENMESLDDVNLVSKGHYNLSQNKIISYRFYFDKPVVLPEKINTYDAALGSYLSSFDNERDRLEMAKLADRLTLIDEYQKGHTGFSYQYCTSQADGKMAWMRVVVSTFKEPTRGEIECFTCAYEVSQKVLETQILSSFFTLGYEEIGFLYMDIARCSSFRLNTDGKRIQIAGNYRETLEIFKKQYFLPERAEETVRQLSIETINSELEKANIYTVSFPLRNEDGQIRQKSFQFSWFDESHLISYYCLKDITKEFEADQKQIAELAAAKFAADEANNAKSVFLSNMSHDLRTPLNGVLGFTDLAIRETDAEKKQDYLQKAQSSGQLLLSLINDTLDLSRIESGKMTLENAVVAEDEINSALINSVKQSAELKHIELRADFDSFPHEYLFVDKLKLQKIVLNLLSNSVKYTQPGGTVTYSVEALDPSLNGCSRRITINDTGIGMSAEFQTKMYEPFSQEHRPEAAAVVGTGLGLSIVRKIVDLMRGTIQVKSEVGRGTSFVVELPLEEAHKKEKTGSAASGGTKVAGWRVLLCEDNALNREIASLMLADLKINVECAEDGRAGLEKFNLSEPDYYDAVLMDLRMPNMNGLEATQAIRALRRPDAETVPIIAMTADAFEEDIKRCIDAGMNAHIAKPINRDQLLAALVSSK